MDDNCGELVEYTGCGCKEVYDIYTMVLFKMRDSVPSARYSSVCNVLHQWSISLIPTYRIYRLSGNINFFMQCKPAMALQMI